MTTQSLDEKIKAIEPEVVDMTVEGLGPWSFSKLKMLNNCPFQFYLKYVVKFKFKQFVPSLITNVGKAAHLIIENLILGKSIDESFKLSRKEFQEILTDDEWEENVANLEYNIIEFRQRLDKFEKNHGVKRYVQELRGGVTRDYQPTGFFADDVFWRGVIDMAMQLENGDLIILDHKTGAPAAMGIRNFASQLDSYKILFHKGIEPISGAQAGIHFIRDGQVLLDDYVPAKDIDGKLINRLEFYLAGAVDKTKELGSFKHIRGGYCKYCDYDSICKPGDLKGVEERTKKYFPIKQIQ